MFSPLGDSFIWMKDLHIHRGKEINGKKKKKKNGQAMYFSMQQTNKFSRSESCRHKPKPNIYGLQTHEP